MAPATFSVLVTKVSNNIVLYSDVLKFKFVWCIFNNVDFVILLRYVHDSLSAVFRL